MYSSGRDVPDVLAGILETRGDVSLALARELTKQYEEWLTGSVSEVLADWNANPRKGEVTIVVDRPPETVVDDAALSALLETHSVAEVVELTGVSKRRVYQLSIQKKKNRYTKYIIFDVSLILHLNIHMDYLIYLHQYVL